MNPQSLETKGMPFGGAHGSAAVTKYEHNLFQTGMPRLGQSCPK